MMTGYGEEISVENRHCDTELFMEFIFLSLRRKPDARVKTLPLGTSCCTANKSIEKPRAFRLYHILRF